MVLVFTHATVVMYSRHWNNGLLDHFQHAHFFKMADLVMDHLIHLLIVYGDVTTKNIYLNEHGGMEYLLKRAWQHRITKLGLCCRKL